MSIVPFLPSTPEEYNRAAAEYCRSLPLEHFMEATPQATQREIVLASFAVLQLRIPDFQYFNELLVQYLFQGELRQVVPDNMAIRSTAPSRARTNYAVVLEPAPIFWVLEYVSPRTEGKDYEDSFQKYEKELCVPYCLLFHPPKQELRLYRHNGTGYVRMEPDVNGRMLIPELELEVGLYQSWVRLWHRGELLELPGDLQKHIDALRRQVELQAHQLTEQAQRIHQLQERLHRQVEKRAREASRQDILDQLATRASSEQLMQWLEELG